MTDFNCTCHLILENAYETNICMYIYVPFLFGVALKSCQIEMCVSLMTSIAHMILWSCSKNRKIYCRCCRADVLSILYLNCLQLLYATTFLQNQRNVVRFACHLFCVGFKIKRFSALLLSNHFPIMNYRLNCLYLTQLL